MGSQHKGIPAAEPGVALLLVVSGLPLHQDSSKAAASVCREDDHLLGNL